ncbi:MAG TPA: PAS domain S-box protein [Prolixibacteraceae bacterium]
MNKYIIADPVIENVVALKSMIEKYDLQTEILLSNTGSGVFPLVAFENPDVLFINLKLPDQKGTEICKKLKADPLTRDIPVILTGTNQEQKNSVDEIIISGAEAILTFPLDELLFAIQLQSVLKISKSTHNLVNNQQITEDQIEIKLEIEKLKTTESELRNTVKKLENSESLLRTIIDNAPFEIWTRNKEGFGILENNATIKHFGSILGKKPNMQSILPEASTIWNSNNDKALQRNIIDEECEFDFRGEKKNYHQIIVPILSDNSVERIAGFNIDITERKRAEKALLESENLYRNLVERLPDGVYKSTHEGKFIDVNQAMVKMLGYGSKEELISIDIKKELYFQPEDRESLVLQEKLEEMGIFRLKKKDGSEIWVEDHGWYSLDENGEILYHEGIMRDITERKLADEALKESEERFKLLFDKAPISYQSLDENGYLIDVNETWLEMTGYQKDKVIGCWFGDFLTPESLKLFKNRFQNFKANGKIHVEFEMIKKDGSVIIIQLEGQIGHTSSGNFKQTHCVISDITERQKAEKAIADERILLRTLIDNIPDAIYVKDTLGRKLISNKADLEALGLSDEKEVIGKTDMELSYSGDASQTFSDDRSVIQTAQPILNRLEFFTDTKGAKRYFLTSKVPLTNDSGEIIGLVGVGHDVTREKQTEQKIIQLSKGIEQSPASIVITDIDGNIEYVNLKFTEITGYEFNEVKGRNPKILQSGYTLKEEYIKLWETINSGNEYHGEIQNRKRNGDLYWESVLISPIRDEEGTIINFMAIKEDITNRKKSDLEILKLSVAIEQNPASVIITDTRGVIEYVNKKFLTVSGYSKDELIGKVIRILKPGHTSEERYIEIWNSLFAGNEWRGEHLNRTKNREKYWESILISPIKNQEGKINNYIILSEDISERKKMEKDLIAAKVKAEESDRLKSAFLANMSHEIRTPLNSILGFSELLTEINLDSETRSEFATLINSSGNNLLSIINDVLDISKIEAGQIVLTENEFSAQQLIAKIQKEYALKASSKGIELRLSNQKPDQNFIILSDEIRIKQVLINFVGNALKFTDSGYIEIGVKMVKNNIQFHVKDTGIGIAKEFHDKIFDRFRQVEAAQTRKYGGNGLGLAITKNLAELLGGKIDIESEPDKGSTFFFTLPEARIVKQNE